MRNKVLTVYVKITSLNIYRICLEDSSPKNNNSSLYFVEYKAKFVKNKFTHSTVTQICHMTSEELDFSEHCLIYIFYICYF